MICIKESDNMCNSKKRSIERRDKKYFKKGFMPYSKNEDETSISWLQTNPPDSLALSMLCEGSKGYEEKAILNGTNFWMCSASYAKNSTLSQYCWWNEDSFSSNCIPPQKQIKTISSFGSSPKSGKHVVNHQPCYKKHNAEPINLHLSK